MNTNFYKGGWENNTQYTENSTAQHSVPSHQKDCKHKWWTESKYNKNSSSNNNSFYILLLSLCVFYYTAIVA